MARRHNLARRVATHFDQLLNGALFEVLEMPFMAARLHNVFQFFGGMAAVGVPLAQAKSAQNERRRTLDDHDERLRNPVEHEQRGRREHRQPVRLFEGEVLRNHFTDDHVRITDDEKRERECDAVQHDARHLRLKRLERIAQQAVERAFTSPSETQASQRYAQLGNRE